jgi:predicted AAA+ superfamily ATPase
LRATFPDALHVDLLEPLTFRTMQARPETFIDLVRAHPAARTVVVDEVQRVSDLLPAVHLLMEEDRNRRFVLTGSSARKLRRTGVDLLAGRALRCEMHPFLATELGSRFDLGRALRTGLVPLVEAADDPGGAIRAYVTLYLREEVQAEGLVRNLGNFTRFLETMSFSHAAVVNLSNVAAECQVGRKTAEGFLSVLEDLLLGYRLPVFTRRAARATATHPKFYYFDAGVFRALRPAGPLDRPEEADGAALEGLVAQHLRAWIAASDAGDGLWTWRTRGGSEVDFVVYGPRRFAAVEVKNSGTVRPADLRGLSAFAEDYPEARTLLLHRGSRPLRIGPHLCLPVAAFLSELVPGSDLPGVGADSG